MTNWGGGPLKFCKRVGRLWCRFFYCFHRSHLPKLCRPNFSIMEWLHFCECPAQDCKFTNLSISRTRIYSRKLTRFWFLVRYKRGAPFQLFGAWLVNLVWAATLRSSIWASRLLWRISWHQLPWFLTFWVNFWSEFSFWVLFEMVLSTGIAYVWGQQFQTKYACKTQIWWRPYAFFRGLW